MNARIVSLLASALVLVACNAESPTAVHVDTKTASRRSGGPLGKKPAASIEATQMRYADSIPGFGGYYFDKKGDLVVYLLDTTQFDAANRILTPVLAEHAQVSGASIRPALAKYGFLQLMEWRHAFAMSVSETPGINSIGIDKATNHVRVTVVDEATLRAVEAVGADYGVPREAIDIVTTAKEQDFTDYLYTYAPNGLHAGGLKIQGQYGMATLGPCSLGFNTYSGDFFVTASHCTGRRGSEGTSPTVFFQPDFSGIYIGFESNDPEYFGDLENKDCDFAQKHCRFSDAALIAYTTLAKPGPAGQGRIYATPFASGVLGVAGSREISGSYVITDEATDTPQGITLQKVGAATGWTYGAVFQTCQDQIASGWEYLCQDEVAAYGNFGDSGSPVFELLGNGNVKLYGILRGGNSSKFDFSPLSAIWAEVGYVPATQ